MSKYALVLAGGYGKRLLPITETLPKPLLPYGTDTVYQNAVRQLVKHGFTEIAVTTMYKAEMIEAVRIKGAQLCFYRENVPLGTVGCVKSAAAAYDDSFIVVSGDTVCDFDFDAIMKEHKRSGAILSVVCTRVNKPTEYGTVFVRGGSIAHFVEKPSWRRTLTNLVSTGIYVLEPEVLALIGDGKQDFASDLFPKMLAAGVPIHCIEASGYWCDIGDIESYYRCCFRAAGNVRNVLFGSARLAPDSAVNGCILFDGATVDEGSAAYGSIVCAGARLSRGCFVGESCVLGANTVIGEGAYISSGTLLKAGLSVEKGTRVMKSIVFGEIRKRHIENGKIIGRYGSFVNGEFCASLGGALSYTAGAGAAIGVMHSDSAESAALADGILCGVRLYGGRALNLEDGFDALCAFAAKEYSLAFSVIVKVKSGIASIALFDGDGLPPTAAEERAIEAAIARPTPTAVSAGEMITLAPEERVKFRYAQALTETIPTLEGASFIIKEKNSASEFLYAVAEKLGASVKYESDEAEDAFFVSKDGLYAEALLKDGSECSFWSLICIGATLGGEVALPVRSPRFVEEAVLRGGGRPVFYGEAGGREREAAYRCFWSCDGNALALRALYAALKLKKPLGVLASQTPKQTVESKTVRCNEEEKARTIGRLYEKGNAARGGEGVVLSYGTGSVTVIPLSTGGFRLFAEAVSAEAAEELFIKTEKEIKRAET